MDDGIYTFGENIWKSFLVTCSCGHVHFSIRHGITFYFCIIDITILLFIFVLLIITFLLFIFVLLILLFYFLFFKETKYALFDTYFNQAVVRTTS